MKIWKNNIIGKFLDKYIVLVIIGMMSILITLQSRSSIISDGGSEIDSSVFRYVAYAMKHGQTMYIDTFDHKGPLLYILNYLAMELSFKHGVWILGTVGMFVSLLFSYKLARLYSGRSSSILTIMLTYSYLAFFYEGGNLAEDWALPFMTISMYIFTIYLIRKNIQLWKVIITGVCCSVVALIRINMIAIWIVFAVFLVISLSRTREFKKLFKYSLAFISGVLIVAVPTLGYLGYNGAIQEFFNQYIFFNLEYQKSELWLKYDVIVYFLRNPIIYLNAASYIFLFHKSKQNKQIHSVLQVSIFSVFCLIVSFIVLGQSGRFYEHYAMILLPNLIFPLCIIVELLRNELKEREINRNLLSYIILFYCMVSIAIPNWSKCIQNIQEAQTMYDFYTEDIINEYIKKLTNVNDPISVVGNKNYIYLRANRMSASKYSYQFPVAAASDNIFNEYMEDLQVTQPKVIIWTNRDAKGYEKYFDQLELFLQTNQYELVEQSEYYVYTR